MEEELNTILSNPELDEQGKTEAIKKLVGNNYIPRDKFNSSNKTKDEAYNALKTEFEAFKRSKMTEDERQQEQAKIMQEQYRNANLMISKMGAENTFAKAGFEEKDYKEILDTIVTDNPEATRNLAETICATMVKTKQEAEKAIKDKIVQNTKKPPEGNANNSTEDGELEKLKKGLSEAQAKNDFVNMAMYTRLIAEKNNKE